MEYQKITNLLGNISDKIPGFITKKWIEVHDQSGTAEDRYKPSKQTKFKTSMLRYDLCDYSDANIVVKGTITLRDRRGANNIRDRKNRPLAFKNNAPFISCILKMYLKCTICLSIAKITQRHLVLYEIIIEIN